MFRMILSGMEHHKAPILVPQNTIISAKGTQQRVEVLGRQLAQRVSDSYIVDMAHQGMSTMYGMTSKERLSSLDQSTGLSFQGAEGMLFVDIQEDENHSVTPQHLVLICFL